MGGLLVSIGLTIVGISEYNLSLIAGALVSAQAASPKLLPQLLYSQGMIILTAFLVAMLYFTCNKDNSNYNCYYNYQ